MTTPNPTEVAPWYLRNINQALALDSATGNVYIRTNAAIVGNVSVGNVAIGSLGNIDLSHTYMPVSVVGNIVGITNPVTVTGNINAAVTGNVGIIGNVAGITGNVNVTQGTTPWSVIGNVSITNPATDITIADSTYEMNVARGVVSGQYLEFKNGYCATMAAPGGPKTIWGQAIVYPWASWTTAQKLYIISDSSSDTGQTVYIDGLDSSYTKISETVTTNGLTPVATTQNFLRINHCYLTAGATNVGNITQRLTSGTGTIVGGMLPGFGRNKQGVFTVPANYTAYILYGDVTSYKNGSGQVDGQVDMFVRTSQTTPFINVFAGISANGQYRNEFMVPLMAPQRSDIDVRFDPSGTCTVACNWEMILVHN
jgi:hypothetical protein